MSDAKQIIQAYIEAYNQRNVPGMLELVDDQLVFENVSNASDSVKTTTKQEFEQIAYQSLTYFTERNQAIRYIVLGNNSVAVEIDYRAVLALDMPNGLKAGESIHLRGVSIFELHAGKIARISDYS